MKTIAKLLLLLIFTSCVTNKQSTYLQGTTDDVTYNFPHKTYKTQINDALIVNVKASNKELLSFFSELTNGSGQQSGNSQNINPYLTGYTINKHGNIRLPYIGEINVLGYTILEVRNKIETELGKLIKNKNSFFVDVKQAGIKFTILGEIGQPGTKNLLQYEVNIIDAIANSGDVTLYGNRRTVEVIRQEESGVKKYIIDTTDIAAINSDVFLIKNNDIINIKPLKQKPIGLGTTGLSIFNTIISTLTVAITTIFFVRNL